MTSSATAIRFEEAALASGVRLRYADAGPRTGAPVLLLHGYSDSWYSFSMLLDLLAPNLRLIIPDQRGHGDSQKPLSGYTPASLAQDALSLLDAVGLERAAVVGHSMGGFVAQHLAALAPQRVTQVVLAGSAARSANDAVRGLSATVASLTDPVDEGFVREFQQSTIWRPVPPSFFERAVEESLKLPARVWRSVLSGLLQPYVPLSAPACPTHLFWGDRDAIFNREDQEELLRLIPGAKLHLFPNTGHALHWEAPAEFARRLSGIL
ncbi:MAG: alpha/beta hydrolase [Bryobacteraceae bacterium]|nr:alpha/beta hydrolase [Bryobacteraceae bacterium]